MEILLLTNIHRIIWAAIKAVVLLMLFYFIYDSVFIYPSFPEKGELIGKVFSWLYSFISSNWQTITLLFILGYSWASYRISKVASRRIEQVEVIAFSQLSYFNYTPSTDINRITSGKELIKSIITGWVLSWLGVDNPKDLPWSARAERYAGEEITLKGDLNNEPNENEQNT